MQLFSWIGNEFTKKKQHRNEFKLTDYYFSFFGIVWATGDKESVAFREQAIQKVQKVQFTRQFSFQSPLNDEHGATERAIKSNNNGTEWDPATGYIVAGP